MAVTSDPYRRRDGEPGPLAGTRVVDLTAARAGPVCSRQLADLGADVVWVAHPRRGDLGGSDAHNLRRGKRSIVIDLARPAGVDVFWRLVARSDVLVENFRPGVTTRLGIDADAVLARNARLVYASISGFGQTGPYARRPGVDQIAQGMGGLMSVTGPPSSGPWRAGAALSDVAAGSLLTQAVLAALLHRERTGRGQWVHTSLLEAMLALMDFQAVRWLADGEVPAQAGNDHPSVAPMGMFEAADGHVNVAASVAWERFVDAVGRPAVLADDPRFADGAGRLRHRDAVRAACAQVLRSRPVAHWVEVLNDAGVPAGPVLGLDEVFADPQVEHLDMVREVPHPTAGTMPTLRSSITMSDAAVGVRGGSPAAGADTRAVLAELGLDDAAVDELVEAGAVAEHSDAAGWNG